MPELPEVQTTVNGLNRKIVGLKITGAWFDWPKSIFYFINSKLSRKPSIGDFLKFLRNSQILKIERKGKNILIHLSNNLLILIHQKMTGHLMVGKWVVKKNKVIPIEPKEAVNDLQNRFIHFILYLNNGQMVALSDLRKFAKIIFGNKEQIENLPDIRDLGPDALDKNLTFEEFKKNIQKTHGKIKQILMDQNVVAGIGNIYSDEILFAARVHPFKPVNKLSEKELKMIYLATKDILKKALKLRGTSISDYRDIYGEKGGYSDVRLVYRREGEKCPRGCGGIIKRVKIGGRSAHYCPKCQKL